MTQKSSKPVLIELPDDPMTLPQAFEEDSTENSTENSTGPGPKIRRGVRLVGLTFALFAAIVSTLFGIYLIDTITVLLNERPLLGQIFAGLVAVFVLALLWLAFRELRAFSRFRRITRLRGDLDAVADTATQAETMRAIGPMLTLYRGRADVTWGLQRFRDLSRDQLDGDALLNLAEAEILTGLDAAAVAEIEKAARQVALVTAIVPIALADLAIALFANLRMIRRLAEIYGGRTGGLGAFRLLRMVFVHLTATGIVAIGDDLISSIAGGGIVSKVSRRFGEGVVNGAMTARIGVAAMELCRPMSFRRAQRPKVRTLLTHALKGVFSTN